MGNPITWQNVNGPSQAGAINPLLASQGSVNGAFDAFQNILRQREALDASNAATLQENGKQAFLDVLQGAKSPEELAALQASGQLDGMRTGLNSASRAALRGSEEARLTGLRQGAVATNTFDDMVRTRAEAPIRDEISSLINNNDFEGARAMLDKHKLQNEAALFGTLTTAQRTKLLQGREDTNYERTSRTSQLQLDELERTTAEGARQRGIDTAADSFITQAQASNAARQKEMEPVFNAFDKERFVDNDGTELKIPRNQDGSVNYTAMGSTLKGQLNDYLSKWQGSKQTVDSLAGSDTELRRQAVEKLRAAGAKTSDLARLDPVLSAGLNTTPQALQGNDLAAAERNQRVQDATINEASKQFVPMSDSAASSEVANSANETINKLWGADSAKAEYWRRSLDKFLTKGIEAKDEKGASIKGADGNPIRVIPSAETVNRLLNTVNTDFWRPFGMKSNDLESRIEDYLKDGSVYKAAGQAVNAGLTRSIRGIDPIQKKDDPKKK